MPLAQTAITLAEAKSTILTPVGRAADTNAQVRAVEFIRDILMELNNKDWRWLKNSTSSAVTSDGKLALPSRFKKFYSVYTSTGPLEQWDTRYYNLVNPLRVGFGGQYVYIPYAEFDNAFILIKDAPAAGSSVTVTANYQRLITQVTNNASVFDVPEFVMPYVLAEGRTRVLADFGGGDTQLQLWMGIAKRTYLDLVSDDKSQPDKQGYIKAQSEITMGDSMMDWGNNV